MSEYFNRNDLDILTVYQLKHILTLHGVTIGDRRSKQILIDMILSSNIKRFPTDKITKRAKMKLATYHGSPIRSKLLHFITSRAWRSISISIYESEIVERYSQMDIETFRYHQMKELAKMNKLTMGSLEKLYDRLKDNEIEGFLIDNGIVVMTQKFSDGLSKDIEHKFVPRTLYIQCT